MNIYSYFGNLLGALFLGWLMIWGEVFEGRDEFTIYLAEKKVRRGSA